ncbi:hypothetical protein ACWDZ4_31225 [Streptomyces sp. NPDC003016]
MGGRVPAAATHPIWNLTPAGQKAPAGSNELPPAPEVGTGAKAVRAGFGPHGVAVTDPILAHGGRAHLSEVIGPGTYGMLVRQAVCGG